MISNNENRTFINAIVNAFKDGGLPQPNKRQLEQFEIYFDYLVEQNKTTNLTAITDPVLAAVNHFYDSAMPIGLIGENTSVIDIGTGAGFPIVPLAILKPNAKCTAIDSTEKKCEFLRRACLLAGVEIDVIHARAEDLAKSEPRSRFDICVSRAVARLNVLMELCAPFIKKGGEFFAYKSDSKEIAEAQNAAEILGLKPIFCVPSMIKGNGHRVFVYRKEFDTPQKYPRQFSKIKKSPL